MGSIFTVVRNVPASLALALVGLILALAGLILITPQLAGSILGEFRVVPGSIFVVVGLVVFLVGVFLGLGHSFFPTLAAVVKKDLKGYFDQPTGYILLVIFAALLAGLGFRQLFIAPEASMRAVISLWLPMLLTLFVPAATMRLVSEEQRDGTLETLLTQPLRTWNVIAAKFIAGFAFVSVGIIASLGIPIALETAGDMDIGAVIAQYFGTFLMTASYVAIGLFASSLTRNQMVALITGLATIGVLTLAGLPIVTLALPSRIAVLIQDLSPLTHYASISRGVLDLRDLLYFVALIMTFLSATYLMIRGKTVSHRSPRYRNLQFGVAALVLISLLVGWFGSFIGGRLDLTEQKLYTLDPATRDIVENLDDIVTIKLFTSQDPPVQISLVTRDVTDFVDDLASASNGRIKLQKIQADTSEEAAEEADRSFVRPQQFNLETQGELQIKLGYLGMGMTYANSQEVIGYIDSLDQLEQRVAGNIYRMTLKEPKTIGMLYGHGEKRRDAELQSWRNQLERQYYVEEFDYVAEGQLDATGRGYDILVIPGSQKEIFPDLFNEIDQYLSEGGKVLILMDPVLIDQQRMRGSANNPGMINWLRDYGIDVGTDVVMDFQAHETLGFGTSYGVVNLPYPYWVQVPTSESAISGGSAGAVFPWASSIEITNRVSNDIRDVEITPLLTTFETAGLDLDYDDLSPRSPRIDELSRTELRERHLAVSITGRRCPPLRAVCEIDPEDVFRMIVATDSDFISEQMAGGREQRYPDHIFLGLNWVDWLAQEDALAQIRGKGERFRPLVFSSDSDLHKNLVQYGNIIGVPALIILIGLVRFFLRRNTTRKVYTRGR